MASVARGLSLSVSATSPYLVLLVWRWATQLDQHVAKAIGGDKAYRVKFTTGQVVVLNAYGRTADVSR